MPNKRRFCAVCQCEIPAERVEAEEQTRLCKVHAEAIQKYAANSLGPASTRASAKPKVSKRTTVT